MNGVVTGRLLQGHGAGWEISRHGGSQRQKRTEGATGSTKAAPRCRLDASRRRWGAMSGRRKSALGERRGMAAAWSTRGGRRQVLAGPNQSHARHMTCYYWRHPATAPSGHAARAVRSPRAAMPRARWLRECRRGLHDDVRGSLAAADVPSSDPGPVWRRRRARRAPAHHHEHVARHAARRSPARLQLHRAARPALVRARRSPIVCARHYRLSAAVPSPSRPCGAAGVCLGASRRSDAPAAAARNTASVVNCLAP